MKLLALDTSTLTAGAAVLVDGQLVAERRNRVTTHSELLLALLDGTLADAGLRPRDLDAVACGAGPGSFTGLRIGLSTAKGLCFALGKPLALVSSLEAVAARAPDGRACAILDAHKNEVYSALYTIENGVPRALGSDGEQVLPPASLLAQLSAVELPLTLVGDGALRYRELFAPIGQPIDDDGSPRAADIARLGLQALARGEAEPLGRSGPRYVRLSEPELLKLKRERNQ